MARSRRTGRLRRPRAAALAAVAAMSLAACGGSESGDGSNAAPRREGRAASVTVESLSFDPKTLEVASGTEVTWTNADTVAHTVTSGIQGEQGAPGVSEDEPAQPDGVFDGDLTEEGEAFSFTFDEAGTYSYYCDIHRQMTGEIVVE